MSGFSFNPVELSSDGTSLVSGDGTILIPVVGGMSTEATAAIATANTNKLQAALAAGGLVQVLAPGTYYLDPLQSLVMPSKTKLVLGAGVSLVSRTGRICPVIRNKYSGNIIAGPQLVRASNVVTVTEAGHTKAVGDIIFVKAVSSSGTDSSFIATVTVLSVVAGVSWTYASTGSNSTAGAATVFYGLIPVRQQLAGTAMTATSLYVLVTEPGHDKRPGMNVWIGKDGGDNFAPGIVQVTKVTADTWTYATSAASGTASGTFSLSYDYDIEIDGGVIDGNRAGLGSVATGSGAMNSASFFGNVTGLRLNSRIGGSNVRGTEFKNCSNVLLDKMWAPFDCLVGAQFEGGGVGIVVDQAVSGNDALTTVTAQKADDFVAFTGVAAVGGGGNYDDYASPYGLTFFDGIDVRSINAAGALNGIKMSAMAACPFRGVLRIGRVYARNLDNAPLIGTGTMLKVFDDGPSLVATTFDTIQIDGPINWNNATSAGGAIYLGGAGSGNIVRARGLHSEPNQLDCVKLANTFTLGLLDIDASRFTALGTNNPQVNMSGGTVRKMMVRNSSIVVGTAQPFVTFGGGAMNHLAFENCQFSGVSAGVGDIVDYALASAALNVLSFKGCRVPTGGNGFNSLCVFASGLAIPALDITLDDHDVTSASGIRCNDATTTGTVNIYLGAKVKWTATGGNNFLQVGGSGSSMTWNLWGDSGNRNSLPATKVFLTGFGTPVYKSIGFTQAVASSATPALRCGLGNNVTFTATAASLWGAPSEVPPAGTPVTITITQDGTGGWAITWNAAYIFPTAWSNTGNTAGKKSVASFISDGTSLVAQGGNVWY